LSQVKQVLSIKERYLEQPIFAATTCDKANFSESSESTVKVVLPFFHLDGASHIKGLGALVKEVKVISTLSPHSPYFYPYPYSLYFLVFGLRSYKSIHYFH
jgi:hypothetical protein